MNSSMCEDKEILIEILSRLPAKSLVRFMSVCRLWKSIITGPQFRLASNRPTRLLVHTNRECYTVVEDEEDGKKADVVFGSDFPLRHLSYEKAALVGSDNGLICIVIFPSTPTPRNGRVEQLFIVWNPCIRKHLVFPDLPGDVFSEFSAGFGGTISGLDYKFVRIVGYTVSVVEDGRIQQKAFHIYSLKAGTWRRFCLDYNLYLKRNFSRIPALLRGRLHWVVSEPINSNYISTLELENEVFENNAIVLPEQLSTTFSYLLTQDVTVIKESLAVIALEYGQNCALWVMQEYGDVGSWVKLWNIDQTMEDFDMFRSHLVGVLKNGELLLGLFGLWRTPQLKLVTCDPKTMKTNHFGGGVLSPTEVCGFTNYYKESLVLLADDDRAVPDHKVLSLFVPSPAGRPLNHNAPVVPVLFRTLPDQFGYYYVWTGFHWLLVSPQL